MLRKDRYTLSSMIVRQILDKYNAQNAKYNVEYLEMVLDEETDTEIIGPRMLDLCQSGMPYTGMYLREKDAEYVTLVQYMKLVKLHKDFCTIEIAWDDDPMYKAEYKEFKRE